jgi:Cytochrome c554 and c-prime
MVRRVVVSFLVAALALGAQGETPATSKQQVSTEERLQRPGWWPRKATPTRSEYVGPAACAECHSDVAATQRTSAMARTSTTASKSFALNSSDQNKFDVGPFHYQLQRSGENFSYSLNSGTQSISEPLGWAFGTEKIGQSYVFEKKGALHLSVFSYFEGLHGFAQTPAIDLVPLPATMREPLRKGAGRPLEKQTAEGCFTCHNTAAMTEGKLDPSHLIPSVTCEACHGPGAKHASAERSAADGAENLIFNPQQLSPVESVDFCGSCHRTWWDVMLTEEVGVSTVLAVPYRLEKSRCWGNGDARITCVACHSPHRPLDNDIASYDQRCLSCHVKNGSQPTSDHPGAACTVGTEKCATCHMPKYEVQDMHCNFTDHMIRIVRAGAPFPD